MTGGDDLEGLTEEATASADLGEQPGSPEITRSTYWAVQAVTSRGETRVGSKADLGLETDPEEPTDPLPPHAPPPPRRRGLRLLIVAALITLSILGCLGLATVWLLVHHLTPGEPAREPQPLAATVRPTPAQAPTPQPPVEPVPARPAARPASPSPQPPASEPAIAEPVPVQEQPEPTLDPIDLEPSSGPQGPPAEPVVALGESAPEPASPLLHIGEISLSGPGSEAQLRNVLVLAQTDLLACYAQALEHDPTLQATLSLNLRLLADGGVLGARARERRADVPVLSQCVERVMLSERFPGYPGAASIIVPLSFTLTDGTSAD